MENRENEASDQPIPIDPILIDITNKVSSQEGITNHEILRDAAWRNLKNYTEKMANQMNKGRKRPNNYEVGDLVRISVPKIIILALTDLHSHAKSWRKLIIIIS